MSAFALPAHEAGRYGEIEAVSSSYMATTMFTVGLEPPMPPVVIKGLPEDADPVLKERLAIEARILDELDHPQIPSLVADHTAEEAPYFAMTRAEDDLVRFALKRRSNPEAAAKIIQSTLDPLAYVHEKKFIHRDIKPANIAVDGMYRAVLLDFGGATPRPYGHLIEAGEVVTGSEEHRKAREHMLAFSSLKTSGKSVLSAEYMSPEQAAQDPHVDVASDIYNLGISAYELFYGKTPFRLDASGTELSLVEDAAYDAVISPAEQRIQRFARLHREEPIDFTIPSDREISDEVIDFIERATQKDPADRYQSAEEMSEDVEIALRAVA